MRNTAVAIVSDIGRGRPDHIRSHNGPEFAAAPFQDWRQRVGIQPIRIYPGSPWENGYNERFNGTLRHEGLNAEWFATTQQAQLVINTWLRPFIAAKCCGTGKTKTMSAECTHAS